MENRKVQSKIPIMSLIQDPNLGSDPHTDSSCFTCIPILQLFPCKLLHFM